MLHIAFIQGIDCALHSSIHTHIHTQMAEETMQGIQPAHQELGTLQEPSMFKDGFSTPEPLCVHSLSVVAFLFGKDVYVL